MDKPTTLPPAHLFKIAPFTAASRDRPGLWTSRPASPVDLPSTDSRNASMLWQHAVHDVRGKLGVVANITLLLQRPCTDERRLALASMLDRNVTSLGLLLDGMDDLARHEAVAEAPVLRPLNAAVVLQGVCDSVMALAETRGLRVEYRGPAVLPVETDARLLERIAQNLMLNAVRYTTSHGVVLTCGASDRVAPGRWFFEVRDATPVQAVGALHLPLQGLPVSPAAQPLPAGEGLGLAIVARLSRLLGAEVEMASTGTGRWTRVSQPRRGGAALATLPGGAPRATRAMRPGQAARP
ncbi:sensor histidine kinase [Roseateles cellulosilyticus]|uniref:histidine kinase n=1 Tax=Pelomonas cellulosilytica TaxID=2906762 RepID=A0ABS8Y0Z2_9BURK|nr:HAMP domain-containing sensor histidine kinase [Pelomonas sp. P8]MCE4557872.1 HAMP domain-containing histidine kinase [Pelomonas sp. P8]